MHSKKQKDKTLECPRCWVEMKKEEVDVLGPNVIIDVCLNCNGAWLDYGELEKLKEKSEAGYTGDKEAKAVEEWEEMMAKRRGKRLSSLFGRLMR